MQQQHVVKLVVPKSELCELFSWVAALKGTVLVSTSLAEKPYFNGEVRNGENGKAKAKPAASHLDDDPRLVRNEDGRIVIGESLTGLGLTEDYLRSTSTKCGTSEHKVKMAILRRKGSKAVAK